MTNWISLSMQEYTAILRQFRELKKQNDRYKIALLAHKTKIQELSDLLEAREAEVA